MAMIKRRSLRTGLLLGSLSFTALLSLVPTSRGQHQWIRSTSSSWRERLFGNATTAGEGRGIAGGGSVEAVAATPGNWERTMTNNFLFSRHDDDVVSNEPKAVDPLLEKNKDTAASSTTSRRTQQQTPPNKPLNVIILYTDDMRHDSLGAAGTQPVFTPRLDELARNGIRFARNCVTTSICWISRATLFTGQYLSRHKSSKLFRTVFYDKWNTTWPFLLQQKKDYYVGHIGKWQFDRPEFVTKSFNWTRLFEGSHYHNIPGKGWVHTTDHTRDSTIDFLRERPKDKNFALTVAFYPPKAVGGATPYNPKRESAFLYTNVTIPPPVEDPEIGWSHLNRTVFTSTNQARKTYGLFDTKEKYQKNMKAMYRMINEVDAACGSIIDELQRQDLLDSTMIIFTADNGFLQAEHGLAGKWFPFEESIRVPLIVYDPRMSTANRNVVREEFTLNVDLAATILGAAGIDPPRGMQGRDIADLYLDDDADDWRTEFYYEHPTHVAESVIPQSSAIVRKDLKYMIWDNLRVESLYDMVKDPNELRNVINDPTYSEALKNLKQRYQELKQKVKEPF
jgi:arylsulfatase